MASWNGFRSHGLLNDNQNILRTFSYYPGVDRPHSVMTDSATYYYATDPTGSVIGLAEFDGAASVVNHYRYDVWGMPQGTETEGVENPIRFKARWWDEDTGLLDFRSRWYDPEIGRFISEDPIGLAGGINVYRFVGNNPIAGWDPYGLANEDTPCSQVQGTDTCSLPSLHVNGSQSGDSNPLITILYLLPDEPLRRRPLGTFRAGGKAAGGGSAGSAVADTVESACADGHAFVAGQCRQLLTGVVPDFIGPAKLGKLIRGFAIDHRGLRHGLHQAIGRDGHGVSSAAILNALRNPRRIVQQARGRLKYIGDNAVVIMNDARELVTTWATSRSGWRF